MSEEIPLLKRSPEGGLGREEFGFSVFSGPRLQNLEKKYVSLSSLNLQNIAAEWTRHHQEWEKNEGIFSSIRPVSTSEVKDNAKLTRNMIVVASDLKASQLNSPRRDLGHRKTLYCSLPFMCQFGMHQRETEVVDVLKSIHEIETPQEPIVILDEVMTDQNIFTLPLFVATLSVMAVQFIVGYNLVVMNAAEKFIFPRHSILMWSFVVASLAIGAIFGAYSGGYISNLLGRRSTIILTHWIFLIGGFAMFISPLIEFLMIGRFVVGYGSGLSMVVGPIYLGEIAPPTVRGSLGTCVQFALVIGILCATVFTYPLGSPSTWRFLFLVTPLIALCGLLISPSLLESPKWLLLRNNQLSRARHVIRLLRGYRSDDDVDLELESVSFACGLHSEKKCLPPEPSLWALLTTSNHCLRRSVAMILLFQICQQFSGINIVFYYSSRLLEGVISSPLMGTILLSLVNVAATYLSLVLMDHTKRRTLLIISDSGMLLSLFITTLALYSNFIPNFVAFLGLIVFVVLFELGLGPIPLLIAAELFDVGSVGSAMSLACICHWICNFLVGISFPFLLQQLGPLCFLPYLFLLMAGLIFILVFFDEKPCSPKEIQGYLKPVIIAEHSSAHAEEKPISDESF